MVGKARKRGVGPRRAARAREEEEEQEEQGPPPSPGSPSYFQDQVDAFHEARAQAALAPSWSDGESGAEDPEEEEEVLGLDVAEEEEEEDEDDEEDAGSVGGSSVLSEAGGDADPSLSWGRRKGFYYDTDYGAPRGGRPQSQQEAEEAAREEEEEARLIQRRLAQAVHEDDVGLGWLPAGAPEPREPRSRVAADLAGLPTKQKLKLLRREAPELLELVADLRAKLAELRDELGPLLRRVPGGRGGRYLRTKASLYLHYCANVCFYLVLKARRAPVLSHPVIPRLVTYRRLIGRLAPVDRRLAPDVRRLLAGAPGPSARAAPPEPLEESEEEEEPIARLTREQEQEREEEENPGAKRKKEPEPEEEPSAKRAITYQIAKNKGLTPRRKKRDRNPRVKHREKFRRATIRRRGQVRLPRTEMHKYAGELSGIRAGVKKSIRLK
ncbi:something about silencing protein 10 [Petaurus breviceps papuanus]|uniref:something about silencing protein 10 n=1 Tax=Petaurus breviceps papuanus TaxID=3040969 RepID=UPI0036D8D28C